MDHHINSLNTKKVKLISGSYKEGQIETLNKSKLCSVKGEQHMGLIVLYARIHPQLSHTQGRLFHKKAQVSTFCSSATSQNSFLHPILVTSALFLTLQHNFLDPPAEINLISLLH